MLVAIVTTAVIGVVFRAVARRRALPDQAVRDWTRTGSEPMQAVEVDLDEPDR